MYIKRLGLNILNTFGKNLIIPTRSCTHIKILIFRVNFEQSSTLKFHFIINNNSVAEFQIPTLISNISRDLRKLKLFEYWRNLLYQF